MRRVPQAGQMPRRCAPKEVPLGDRRKPPFSLPCSHCNEGAESRARECRRPGTHRTGPEISNRRDEFFMMHIRGWLNARRTSSMYSRLVMVTLKPEELQARQWICHRDSAGLAPSQCIAASVLYLFHDPALGGTSIYMPKKSSQETSLLVHDSGTSSNEMFAQKYGIQPGYRSASNAYFEKIYTVPAKWNRMIFYDGRIFHRGEIPHPEKMNANPLSGRLTLNGFFTCSRKAV